MKVGEIMTTPVVTVERETTIHDAIESMLKNKVGSAVVVVDGNAVGILTRSDALRAAYHEGANLKEIQVARAMSGNLQTITESRTVRSALRTMETNNIKKLPITDDFRPVGIVTMTDIAHHLPDEVRQAQENLERQDDWSG